MFPVIGARTAEPEYDSHIKPSGMHVTRAAQGTQVRWKAGATDQMCYIRPF